MRVVIRVRIIFLLCSDFARIQGTCKWRGGIIMVGEMDGSVGMWGQMEIWMDGLVNGLISGLNKRLGLGKHRKSTVLILLCGYQKKIGETPWMDGWVGIGCLGCSLLKNGYKWKYTIKRFLYISVVFLGIFVSRKVLTVCLMSSGFTWHLEILKTHTLIATKEFMHTPVNNCLLCLKEKNTVFILITGTSQLLNTITYCPFI